MDEQKEENWFYECFIEYQKRASVIHQQFFTPPETADLMAYKMSMYANDTDTIIDACSGFGMLSNALIKQGFTRVRAFDYNFDIVESFKMLYGDRYPAELEIYTSNFKNPEVDESVDFIISNPPYDVGDLTEFLGYVEKSLTFGGIAVLLIPSGFLDKTRPKNLVEVLNKFAIKERMPMEEDFARTKIKAEIVVLEKI